jgi:hypothetical protein
VSEGESGVWCRLLQEVPIRPRIEWMEERVRGRLQQDASNAESIHALASISLHLSKYNQPRVVL